MVALLLLVYGIVAAIGYRRRDRGVDGAEVSLCLTCVNAVVTHGTRGEECVVCNYGGAMRPMKFTVCECSGYCSTPSASKLVKIEGFAPDKSEVYVEVAIS